MSAVIEVSGIRLEGRHGVLEEERLEGQEFAIDVLLELAREPARDESEDAVDYREIAASVRAVFEGSQFQLLETLAAAVADALLRRFSAVRARVRVSKPAVTLDGGGRPSVTVERDRRAAAT